MKKNISQEEKKGTLLFDGNSLKDWKISGQQTSFRIEEKAIASNTPGAYLFYAGSLNKGIFRNFDMKVEVMTKPGARGAIHFHTDSHDLQKQGFKIQIYNGYGEGEQFDNFKTGSLFGIRNIYKSLVRDNEWFEIRVQVKDKQVQVWLNNKPIVDYVEADPALIDLVPKLGKGGIALECLSQLKIFFRNIRMMPLPDEIKTPSPSFPQVDDIYRQILQMSKEGYPVVDYHVHLKGGLTLEQSLEASRKLGIMYAISTNGGLKFPITSDEGLLEFLESMKGAPTFIAFQAEGREWVNMFSQETISKFDFVFTDCMTFSDDQGNRLRLWLADEMVEIDDPEKFMNVLVSRIVDIITNEPIDIYVNPTFLPEVLMNDYDRLWTPERMQKIIDAAKANDVAIEISNLYKLPRLPFIQRAKQAGVKFSFGSNNSDPFFGRMEYALEMVKLCGLTWNDIFIPKPEGQKAAQRWKKKLLKVT